MIFLIYKWKNLPLRIISLSLQFILYEPASQNKESQSRMHSLLVKRPLNNHNIKVVI